MPNWVKNELRFECKNNGRIFELMETIKGKNGDMDFESIIPMPDNIFRGNLGKKERELYGKNNWHDWSVKHWGTKWNACEAYAGHTGIEFETAWSAPEPVIKKLSKMFPDVVIEHWWADEDIGYNCGRRKYLNGNVIGRWVGSEGSKNAIKMACDLWGYDYDEYMSEINE